MVLGFLLLVAFIPVLLFWMRMLVDCATKESSQGNDKLVWVLIILFANVFCAAAYWLVRRPQRLAELQH